MKHSNIKENEKREKYHTKSTLQLPEGNKFLFHGYSNIRIDNLIWVATGSKCAVKF